MSIADNGETDYTPYEQQLLRMRDAFDQFERYDLPDDEIIGLLGELTDINDDMKHGRHKDLIVEKVAKCKELLDKIVAEYNH